MVNRGFWVDGFKDYDRIILINNAAWHLFFRNFAEDAGHMKSMERGVWSVAIIKLPRRPLHFTFNILQSIFYILSLQLLPQCLHQHLLRDHFLNSRRHFTDNN